MSRFSMVVRFTLLFPTSVPIGKFPLRGSHRGFPQGVPEGKRETPFLVRPEHVIKENLSGILPRARCPLQWLP